jgi:BTB/POZ domain
MANVTPQDHNLRLFSFYKEGKMTDVTLMVEGQMIEAHKLILAASSKYFEVTKGKWLRLF